MRKPSVQVQKGLLLLVGFLLSVQESAQESELYESKSEQEQIQIDNAIDWIVNLAVELNS